MKQCQWFLRSKKLLNWNHGEKKEENDRKEIIDYFKEGCRWKLQNLMSFVDEGSTIMENNLAMQEVINALKLMVKLGYENEFAVIFIFLFDK